MFGAFVVLWGQDSAGQADDGLAVREDAHVSVCPVEAETMCHMRRRLILVGGCAGSGKTMLARELADSLGAGWLQIDTVWLAMKAATGAGSVAPGLLDVAARMAQASNSDDEVLEAHVAAARAVCDVLPEVFTFELETHQVLVADGAWLLPCFVAGLQVPETEVGSVFLRQPDVESVAAALAPRLGGRPPEERHLLMNRRIWQYGAWLCAEALAHGLPVIDSLPFASLPHRARAALVG